MLVRVSVALIRVYQRTAPSRLRQTCRYEPSCSAYAVFVLEKYGFFAGWKKAIVRISRCKPPNGGVDFP